MLDEASVGAWLTNACGVSRETRGKLDAFSAALISENERQNLVSGQSVEQMFVRHICDSAQLVLHAPDATDWTDLGSGAGLPGLVIAIMTSQPVTLIESRRLRSEWLTRIAGELGLDQVRVLPVAVERVMAPPASVITARAFAPLARLLDTAEHLADENTCWILPKGRSALAELASIEATWHGDFRIEPSVTDAEAKIIVARGVRRKRGSR